MVIHAVLEIIKEIGSYMFESKLALKMLFVCVCVCFLIFMHSLMQKLFTLNVYF